MRSKQVRARIETRRAWLGAFAIVVLAILAVCQLPALLQMVKHPGGALCAAPMIGMAGAAAAMTDEKFRETVLGGVEEIKGTQTKHYAELTGKYDSLDKTTKEQFEAFKKSANESHESALKAINRIDAALRREARMANGDPVKRISANDDLRMNLNAVVRAMILGKNETLDPVFVGHFKDFSKIEKRAVGEDTTPGSAYIMTELLREIYDTLATYGKWNTLGVRRLGTKVTRMPIKTARPLAQFITTEANTINDDTTVAGSEVSLTVLPIAVLLNVSRQVIDDALFDVTAIVLEDFVEAFNQRLDAAVFAGTGVSAGTYGGITGLINYGTAAVATAGNIKAESLQLEDFMRVLTSVDPVVLSRPNAKWWIHPQMLVRLLAVRDRNGRPIFLNALEAPAASGIGTILGYPVELVHAMPYTNAASSVVAAFGDPNSFIVGIREDFAFEATDAFRWNTYERSFRGVGRAGGIGRIATGSAILTLAAQ